MPNIDEDKEKKLDKGHLFGYECKNSWKTDKSKVRLCSYGIEQTCQNTLVVSKGLALPHKVANNLLVTIQLLIDLACPRLILLLWLLSK